MTTKTEAPIGILAGGGGLPEALVNACRAQERPVHVVVLQDHGDPGCYQDVPHRVIRIGAVGKILSSLRTAGCRELVLAGRVQRPAFSELRPDIRGSIVLAKIGMKALGDEGLLSLIAQGFEAEGFKLRGVHELAPELLARSGQYGRLAPDQQGWSDIRRGWQVAKQLGTIDVGQACVVQQGLVLAVEAIEGTDAMVSRLRGLTRKGPKPVLVKTAKPQQDFRLDLPTIGSETIAQATAAGLGGIAIEAGGALVIDRPALIAAADKAKLFVVGVETSDIGEGDAP